MNIIKDLYLTSRFYIAFSIIIFLMAMSFSFPSIFPALQTMLIVFVLVVLADVVQLFFNNNKFEVKRTCPKVMSLSDVNKITISIKNENKRFFSYIVIDEIPAQFQIRDQEFRGVLKAEDTVNIIYDLVPLTRGNYSFGKTNLFIRTKIGFAERRYSINTRQEVPVYPSIIQMKQYSLYALENISHQEGVKKMRKIGHSYEFEQIKEYVSGDDYRAINWKASSRRGDLMVNQYTDEKSQQIYCIIDKSRTMKMPFNGLSLMDYAINTTLTMTNIALLKQDRAGLISFSDKIGSAIKADKQPNQLHKILHSLYREEDRKTEANYEILYQISQKLIKGRSLVLLFTNFESQYALDRVLPTLRQMNQTHLLVVVFFENTEIANFASEKAKTMEGIYHQTIAKKYLQEKNQMVNTLKQYGIQAVLTKPEDLSVNTINKYLEMKARGLI